MDVLKNISGENNRLEALCDGLFAIVLTLLVIEFKVPEHEDMTSALLIGELKRLLPLIYSYVISFFVVAAYWTLHHKITSHFKSCDAQVVKKTFKFLLGISLLPFTTHLNGLYSGTEVAFIVYSANVALCGFALFDLWHYAEKQSSIVPTHTSTEVRTFFMKRLLITPMIFTCSIPVAMFDLSAAKSVWLLLFFITPITNLIQAIVNRITVDIEHEKAMEA